MSIKALVTEHIRIQQAEQKLHERKYKLQDKLNKVDRGIEIIDGVVWKLGWDYGKLTLTRVGEVNEEA